MFLVELHRSYYQREVKPGLVDFDKLAFGNSASMTVEQSRKDSFKSSGMLGACILTPWADMLSRFCRESLLHVKQQIKNGNNHQRVHKSVKKKEKSNARLRIFQVIKFGY